MTAAAMLLVLLVLAAGVLLFTTALVTSQETQTVRAQAAVMAHQINERARVGLPDDALGYSAGTAYVLWDAGVNVLAAPPQLNTDALRPAAVAAAHGRPSIQVLDDNTGGRILVDSRLVDHGGQPVVLQTVRQLTVLTTVESQLPIVVAVAGGGALLVAVLAAWLLAGRWVGPVEAALARERAFVADASHELRTPLSVIDASLQVLRRRPEQKVGAVSDVLVGAEREVRRMRRLVDDLLTLERADAGQQLLKIEDVELDELVRGAVADVTRTSLHDGRSVQTTTAVTGRVDIDPDRVRQLLLALLDNAIQHTPPKTRIEVSAARRGREVLLEVRDDGPGIPEGQREAVFERFHRGGSSRTTSGAGLGLAIVKQIAEAHGGTVRLLDANPGLRVQVVLPAISVSREEAASRRTFGQTQ